MTYLSSGEPISHHIGFASPDTDKLAAIFTETIGAKFNIFEYPVTNIKNEDCIIKVGYGAFAGMIVEIIEPVKGETPQALHLEKYGESVDHIGFWVPDVYEATKEFVAKGAKLNWMAGGENLTASLTAASTEEEVLEAAKKATSGLTYMGLPGKPGGVSIEFLGPPIQTGMTSGQGMLAGCEDLIKMKPEPWFE
tara:strand:+ start:153 stop:734 length:582 start_codon:yes stop_codon:yes gene_type:complete